MSSESTASFEPYAGQRVTPGPVHPPIYPARFDYDVTSLDVYASGIPYETLHEMRRVAPVYWHAEHTPPEPGFWMLSRHADIVAVSTDPATFSSAIGAGCAIAFENPGIEGRLLTPERLALQRASMVHMDPPQHQDLRRLVMPFLMGRGAAKLEEIVRAQVAARIEHVAGLDAFDLVSEFSAAIPVTTLCHLLGVPETERAEVIRLGDTLSGLGDPEFAQAAGVAAREAHAYGWRLLEAKRKTPGEDLLSAAIQAHDAGDARLPPHAMESLFMLFIIAGHRTTRNTITAGLLELYRRPDQLRRLREDPSLIRTAVEEILRWTTVVPTFRRTCTRDVEIRGQQIAAGEKVVLSYAAANFDEDVFEDPLTFDVGRPNANKHLAFGIGEHACVGNMLARLQLRTAIGAFVGAFQDLTVLEPPTYLRANQAASIKRVVVRLG